MSARGNDATARRLASQSLRGSRRSSSILGGTGFLGKVFWSMLLDRFPDVGRIYLLVRPKRAARPRKERFWSDDRDERGARPAPAHARRRLRGVPAREDRRPSTATWGARCCGLDEALVRELAGTIDAVVNVAGVVDFNPPLDEALEVNAFGVQNLVALARALGERAGDVPHEHLLRRRQRARARSTRRTRASYPFPRRGRARRRAVGSGARDRRVPRPHRAGASTARRRVPAERLPRRGRRTSRARGEPARGAALDAELAKVKRKFVERAPRRGGPRARDALGLAEHLHVHEEHRRAGHRALRPAVHDRAPGVLESSVAFPFAGRGTRASTRARRSSTWSMKGQVQIPARARAARHHPGRHGRAPG